VNGFLEILVFLVVRVVSLHVLAEFLVQFNLYEALFLDGFVSEFDGFEHVCFAYLVHFAFYHHDVVIGSCNHELKVAVCHFAECRIDLEFAVDPCDAYF